MIFSPGSPASDGPDISGTPSAGNYARWADADTLEARTTAQVLADIGAANISGTPVANRIATWSDADTLQASAAELTTAGALSGVTTISHSGARTMSGSVANLGGGTRHESGNGNGNDWLWNALTGGSFHFMAGLTTLMSLSASALTLVGVNIAFSSINGTLLRNTSDGSDTGDCGICAGGTDSNTRASRIRSYGNEHATNPGLARIEAGNVTGAYIDHITGGTSRLKVNHDGTVTLHATTLADLRDQVIRTGYYAVAWTATPATGYLNADGSAVSRATYAALFAVIGTTFGVGDGSTTFNLPDASGLNANDIYLHIKT